MKKLMVIILVLSTWALSQTVIKGVELGSTFKQGEFQEVDNSYVLETTLGGVDGTLLVITTLDNTVAAISFTPTGRVSSSTRSTLTQGISKVFDVEISWTSSNEYTGDEAYRIVKDGVLYGGTSKHNQFYDNPYLVQFMWIDVETYTVYETEEQAKANEDF